MLSIDFVIRYFILLLGVLILLRLIYFRISSNREAVFSFFLFSNGVFFITYMLHTVELSMGFAFGLFAVFAMLRYRTEPITIRDMTYLFIVIGVSLMCSIAPAEQAFDYVQLATMIALICVLAFIGESSMLAPRVIEKRITYDNVEYIKPEHEQLLLADLRKRTGLNVIRVDIGKINYLTDSAQLIVFCSPSES